MAWWGHFMEGWNGISLMSGVAPLSTLLVSDASRSWGCGAYWGSRWLQWQILLALVVWGRMQSRCRIECYSDNMAVVVVINPGRARDKRLIHLLRCMFFVAAHLDIQIHASDVPQVGLHRLCRHNFRHNRTAIA